MPLLDFRCHLCFSAHSIYFPLLSLNALFILPPPPVNIMAFYHHSKQFHNTMGISYKKLFYGNYWIHLNLLLKRRSGNRSIDSQLRGLNGERCCLIDVGLCVFYPKNLEKHLHFVTLKCTHFFSMKVTAFIKVSMSEGIRNGGLLWHTSLTHCPS